MNIQILIENPKYVDSIYQKLDYCLKFDSVELIDELPPTYYPDIIGMVSDLNLKLGLNLNLCFESPIKKRSLTYKYLMHGSITGELKCVKN